jgi:hypothetical protein
MPKLFQFHDQGYGFSINLFPKTIALSFDCHIMARNAGVVSLSVTWEKKRVDHWYSPMTSFSFHFFPRKSHIPRQWGYRNTWYDGELKSFGFGPLLLICWMWNY